MFSKNRLIYYKGPLTNTWDQPRREYQCKANFNIYLIILLMQDIIIWFYGFVPVPKIETHQTILLLLFEQANFS